MIYLIKNFRKIYCTKISCAAPLDTTIYDISNRTNSIITTNFFLKPNWLSDVMKKEPNLSRMQCSNNLDITSYSSLGAHVWHMLIRNHTDLPATHTFIHKWNDPYLPLTPSCRSPPHFGWYSFPMQLRVGG